VVAEDSWVPYGDTGGFLRALADRGVPVGVVSDIGWDIRGHARAAGLEDLVGTWVLSCEEGVEKPAPVLFRTACARLGVDPRRTLMVGDNPVRDGGAVAAGLRALVLASEQRDGDRGLGDVLALLRPTRA
jgi:HAD superfamily hydrolase (TIGR01509 family)